MDPYQQGYEEALWQFTKIVEETDLSFGIREVRDRLGVSQSRFSELTGVPVDTLSQYERNRRRPSIESLTPVAIALKIPVALFYIFGSDLPWAITLKERLTEKYFGGKNES